MDLHGTHGTTCLPRWALITIEVAHQKVTSALPYARAPRRLGATETSVSIYVHVERARSSVEFREVSELIAVEIADQDVALPLPPGAERCDGPVVSLRSEARARHRAGVHVHVQHRRPNVVLCDICKTVAVEVGDHDLTKAECSAVQTNTERRHDSGRGQRAGRR